MIRTETAWSLKLHFYIQFSYCSLYGQVCLHIKAIKVHESSSRSGLALSLFIIV